MILFGQLVLLIFVLSAGIEIYRVKFHNKSAMAIFLLSRGAFYSSLISIAISSTACLFISDVTLDKFFYGLGILQIVLMILVYAYLLNS